MEISGDGVETNLTASANYCLQSNFKPQPGSRRTHPRVLRRCLTVTGTSPNRISEPHSRPRPPPMIFVWISTVPPKPSDPQMQESPPRSGRHWQMTGRDAEQDVFRRYATSVNVPPQLPSLGLSVKLAGVRGVGS
jgi:hypothetical protein